MTGPAASAVARTRLDVVTPWWPSAAAPHAGSFVLNATAAVGESFDDAVVTHLLQRGMGRRRWAMRALFPATARGASPQRSPGVAVRQVPFAVPAGSGFSAAAARALTATRRRVGSLTGDVVHAHTVLPAGLVAARLMRPGARLVVTEHASYLSRLLDQADAYDDYAEVLQRAHRVLVVGPGVRDLLARRFPSHAGRVEVVGNAVSVPADLVRSAPPADLKRWVQVGNLVPRKRPLVAVDAFAVALAGAPGASLTFVGDGPLRSEVESRARDLGVAEQVVLTGALPHEQAMRALAQADLLVHLADDETFGMAVAEAVALGVPVLVAPGPALSFVLGADPAVAGGVVGGSDPADVVAAWQALLQRRADLRPAESSQDIAARFGPAAFRRALLDSYGMSA